jgi:hypothetical protein
MLAVASSWGGGNVTVSDSESLIILVNNLLCRSTLLVRFVFELFDLNLLLTDTRPLANRF